jgi:predicted Na+-dependent transporter
MERLLSWLGRHGPVVLVAGVVVGLVAPDIADLAKPWMGVAVFVFTLGAFLKMDVASLRCQCAHPARIAAGLAWVIVGVPLLTALLVTVLPLREACATGVLLAMLGPPGNSTAAMASMLGLDPAFALAITIVAGVLAPLVLSIACFTLGGPHLHIDLLAMTGRVARLTGGAALAALALRTWAPGAMKRHPLALTGLSVVGLVVVALGTMGGVAAEVVTHGADLARATLVAFAFNLGSTLVGVALFARQGLVPALTVGLLSGNRAVTLVWTAVLPWLPDMPGVESVLAASAVATFVLPWVLERLLALWRIRPALEGATR